MVQHHRAPHQKVARAGPDVGKLERIEDAMQRRILLIALAPRFYGDAEQAIVFELEQEQRMRGKLRTGLRLQHEPDIAQLVEGKSRFGVGFNRHLGALVRPVAHRRDGKAVRRQLNVRRVRQIGIPVEILPRRSEHRRERAKQQDQRNRGDRRPQWIGAEPGDQPLHVIRLRRMNRAQACRPIVKRVLASRSRNGAFPSGAFAPVLCACRRNQ